MVKQVMCEELRSWEIVLGNFLVCLKIHILRRYLNDFQMQACKPVDTHVKKGSSTLSISMCPRTSMVKEKMPRVPYLNAVGSLKYTMMCTRIDVCHAVDLVSRFQVNPDFAHWKIVKRIFRYLKETADYMLYYQALDMRLVSYSDADWGDDPDERKFTSGCALLLNGGVITWSSKKQTCVALSSMDAEYIAGSTVAQEDAWLRRVLRELHCRTRWGACQCISWQFVCYCLL